MAEETTQVTACRVDMRCDACGDGFMRFTGEGFTTIETEWKHRCEKCGRFDWYGMTYPRIVYKDVK